MRNVLLLASTAMLAACGTKPLPAIRYDDAKPAMLQPDPPAPVQVIDVPKPLPLPGQLKPLDPPTLPGPPVDPAARAAPVARVAQANAAARVQPSGDGFINAVQLYPFTDGALYQVYTAPGQITDIALEPGEQLVGAGPIAAGDTARWIIGDTESGTGAAKRVHILLKPVRADLSTNLVINTDRRTYHMELRATPKTYMASVSWSYPEDAILAMKRRNAAAQVQAPVTSGVDLNALNFRYEIAGDNPPWRPLRAFDDGRQVFIEFPSGIAQGEMPPVFVVGPKGKDSELVNYRVRGRYIIVDRLFAAAELRLGADKKQQRVRVVRSGGVSPSNGEPRHE